MIKIYQSTIQAIDQELIEASEKFPGSFCSKHEGYAVLLEETEELWDLVKRNGSGSEMYNEAKQVAAMAIRFMQECCREEK